MMCGHTEWTSVAVCFPTCFLLGLYEDRLVKSVKSPDFTPFNSHSHAAFVYLF